MSEQSPDRYQQYLFAAKEIAEEAGKIALQYFRQPLEVVNKLGDEGFDPVTRADKEVEARIRHRLAEHYPDHDIWGEEYGRTGHDKELCWIIDPIDGTRSFMSGDLSWGVLLGLLQNGKPILGMMHQPYTGETFIGGAGIARHYRGGDYVELKSKQNPALSEATIYCTLPSLFERPADRAVFDQAAEQARLVRYGGDCYSLCLVALGYIDAVMEGELQPYDIMPIIPVIEAAGGIVTDFQGRPFTERSSIIAAANPALHQQILALKG